MSEKIIAYKGFDKDLKCRGFQYEIGKVYQHDGNVTACKSGFHACESPLDVFPYYPPAESRFCVVEQSGELSRGGDDSKVASNQIKIRAELGILGLVKAHVEYVKSRTTTEHIDPERAIAGDGGAATAGHGGAATAGDGGAATSRGSVSVGANGCGIVRGNGVKARGGPGAILVICVENDDDFDIKEWKAVEVDGKVVKADTWYTLENGELVKVREEKNDDSL